MVKILENYDLAALNTFRVPIRAKYFTEVESEEDVRELFGEKIFKENKKLFLGGGSNLLFTENFSGIVVLNRLKGIEVVKDGPEAVLVEAMGGESWQALVEFASKHGWWGIENLALIPGSAGAAPIQNIGAYGMELKDSLVRLEAYDIETGEKRIFQNEECAFGYRMSVFKGKLKGKYFITSIVLQLWKKDRRNVSYKVLSDYLEDNAIKVQSPKNISDSVAAIRRSKLPDPAVIGNAGSFFKNVFVSDRKMEELLTHFPNMPHFQETNGDLKIPAAWLIEQCGWKGKKEGNVAVHDKQALVLVNLGGATGQEIKEFSDKIISSVADKFGITLEREVNIC